jgi:acyl carrier protein
MLSRHLADTPASAASLRDELLLFINEALRRRGNTPSEAPVVDGSTPLFESGLIDSLAIVQLMAILERATGRSIPPRMVVMKHFRTVDAICETFGLRAIGL